MRRVADRRVDGVMQGIRAPTDVQIHFQAVLSIFSSRYLLFVRAGAGYIQKLSSSMLEGTSIFNP